MSQARHGACLAMTESCCATLKRSYGRPNVRRARRPRRRRARTSKSPARAVTTTADEDAPAVTASCAARTSRTASACAFACPASSAIGARAACARVSGKTAPPRPWSAWHRSRGGRARRRRCRQRRAIVVHEVQSAESDVTEMERRRAEPAHAAAAHPALDKVRLARRPPRASGEERRPRARVGGRAQWPIVEPGTAPAHPVKSQRATGSYTAPANGMRPRRTPTQIAKPGIPRVKLLVSSTRPSTQACSARARGEGSSGSASPTRPSAGNRRAISRPSVSWMSAAGDRRQRAALEARAYTAQKPVAATSHSHPEQLDHGVTPTAAIVATACYA
jgi:hypothetical protein